MAPPNLGSTEEMRTRFLISLVKERPPIYNKNLPEYTNSEVKRQLWNEIAEKIHRTRWNRWSKAEKREAVLLLQKRWSNLRTTFARELKIYIKAKRNGEEPELKKKYVHFDRMKFIINWLTLGIDGEQKPAVKFFENGEIEEQEKQDDSEDDEVYDEQYLEESSLLEEEYNERASDEGEIEYLENEPLAHPSPVRNEKQENIFVSSFDSIENSSSRNKANKKENINFIVEDESGQDGSIDQEVNFAMSLVPMLRELPRSLKLQAQIDILKIFQKYTDE